MGGDKGWVGHEIKDGQSKMYGLGKERKGDGEARGKGLGKWRDGLGREVRNVNNK